MTHLEFLAEISHTLSEHQHNDNVLKRLLADINEYIVVAEYEDQNERFSSDGLLQLLERHGVQPSGFAKDDIKLARVFMPGSINQKRK